MFWMIFRKKIRSVCLNSDMLKFIISPAKKMKEGGDGVAFRDLPCFLSQTLELLEELRNLSYEEVKKIFRANETICRKNYENYKFFRIDGSLSPAIFSYDGIQYAYMKPNVFTDEELEYLQNHLFILSGFYGLLRPLDGIRPYRLEMGSPFRGRNFDSLYDFWKDLLCKKVYESAETVLNLASEEYAKALRPYIPKDKKWIDVRFFDRVGDKYIEKGIYVKMARGLMVRFLCENRIEEAEEIKEFRELGYRYDKKMSKDDEYVFVKEESKC